jgi:VanZ family protein
MAAQTLQFNFQTPLWQRRVAWLWMAIVAYGSLFPLDWDFDAPNTFGWFEHMGKLDLVKNIALFIPLGLLVAILGRSAERRAAHLLRWAFAAFVLAALLQVAQVYLPRIPEAGDVVTNMAGFAIGYLLQPWLARIHFSVHPRGRIAGADPFLLMLVAIWLFAALFPFLPEWRGGVLREQLAPLLHLEWNKPRQLALHLLTTTTGLTALYLTVRELPRLGRYAGIVLGFAVLLLVEGTLIGFSQTPTLAALLGIVLGVGAWFFLMRLPACQQVFAIGAAGLALYLVYAIMPLNFRAPVFFQWWPFGSLLGGNLSVVLRGYCTEALALGAFMWAMTHMGLRIGSATLVAAGLGFAAEWLQRYLLFRTPEIGTVVIVLVLGFLLHLCQRAVPASPQVQAVAPAQ